MRAEYHARRGQPYSYWSLLVVLVVLGLFALLQRFLPSALGTGLMFGLAFMAFGYLGLARTNAGANRLRVVLTVVFGLIHGTGFASGFIASDLSQGLWLAVVGFNLGVETGQLAFVAIVLGILWTLKPRHRLALQDNVHTVFFGVGVYWFFVRGFADALRPV